MIYSRKEDRRKELGSHPTRFLSNIVSTSDWFHKAQSLSNSLQQTKQREMRKSILTVVFLTYVIQFGIAQEKNLDYFVKLALQNSPLLKDYQNRLQSNRIDSLRLRAGLGPQVNAVSNDSYAPVINGIGYDEAITNGANIYAAVSVSKGIISKKNLQNQLQAVDLQRQAILNPVKISEQDIRKNVIDQYITVYGLLQQVKFYGDELDLLHKEELIFKKLTSTGVYKQTEYLTFVVLLQQQDLQLVQIRNQYRNAFRALHYLCGVMDTATYPLAFPALKLEKLPVLQNSIFYQQFITDSINLVINDKQIDYNYQPKLNLFGEAGFNSSLAYQPWKNFGPSFGLNLSVPIYDGHQRKMQHDQITVSEQTRKYYREFFTKQYGQQINQLLLQLTDVQNLSIRIRKQITYSQALVDANRKLLDSGGVSVTEFIIAMSNLLTTKNMLLQNEIEKYQLINQLNYWCREKQ
jgi:outer membrane protein TolC